MKEFLVIVDRFSVSTINERRRERSQTRQADHVLGERGKASRRIERIRREHRVRSNSFQHTIAGNDRAVGFTQKRTRAGRVSGSVENTQAARFELEFRFVSECSELVVAKRISILS